MSDLGTSLLTLARNSIALELGLPTRGEASDQPALHQPGATFVTLTRDDQLRGCIGSLQAHRPLIDDVRTNASNAAFCDPRFPPMTPEEFATVRVEVSLLTPPAALSFRDEADALSQLRPHIDGVIFAAKGRRSTFLPQVWEQLPTPQLFMAQLKKKAGVPVDYWGPDVTLERYEVKKWKEASP